MGKAEKKSNPGILDWIVDFFVKPIRDAIAKTGVETLKSVGLLAYTEPTAGMKETAIDAKVSLNRLISASSPLTPLEAVQRAQTVIVEAENMLYKLMGDTFVFELMGFGMVDVHAGLLSRHPNTAALLNVGTGFWQEFIEASITPAIRRYVLKQHTPLLPEAYRLSLGVAKGVLSDEEYVRAMAESGLDKFWADMWREQNYEYPSFELITELYWRGLIDDEVWTILMQRLGHNPVVIEALKPLRELIPAADILITGVVREAHVPEMRVEAPGVFAGWMSKKGYSKYWSDWVWTMHFLPIPLGQAYDNLRRGYWTKEDFMYALHIADIHPRWREDIYNVAWNPLTIRELGYAYDVGAVTRGDIVKYRRWGGLSLEDAEKAADSLIAYRTEAEREAVRREYLRLFALGKISEDAFLSNLQRLGTAPPAISLWIERGKLEAERRAKEPAMPEQRVISSSEALWAFRNGLRDEAWTRARLDDLGWTVERINLAIERVKFDIELEVAKEVFEEVRKPSIALIRDYLKYGYVTEDDVPLFLRDLGYADEDAVTMAAIVAEEVAEELRPRILSESDAEALYDMRLLGMGDNDALVKMRAIIGQEGPDSPTLALFGFYRSLKYSEGDAARLTLQTGIRFTFPDLRAMYSKGWITPDVLVSELMRLGLPKIRASELAMTVVKFEEPARVQPERDLTKAEIIKGVKAEILTPVQGVAMLQDIGYNENEAWYILAINKVVGAGHPQGYWEMRRITELAKKARGLPSIEIPDEVVLLEASIREVKGAIQQLVESQASEEAIGEAAVKLAGLESEMRRLVQLKKLQ